MHIHKYQRNVYEARYNTCKKMNVYPPKLKCNTHEQEAFQKEDDVCGSLKHSKSDEFRI